MALALYSRIDSLACLLVKLGVGEYMLRDILPLSFFRLHVQYIITRITSCFCYFFVAPSINLMSVYASLAASRLLTYNTL